jgi:triphosphatase
METELKLLIAPADVAAFRHLALLKQHATARPVTRLLRSTYFDTPDLDLRSHGMELRVRRVGRLSVQTLKTAGDAAQAGLHQRQEWETRVSGPLPEPGKLVALAGAGFTWGSLLGSPGLAQRLAPIFASEVRRTVWHLRWAQESQVELALDQGELRHGDKHELISEIELELKAGDPEALFDLALQLLERVPLRVGNLGKATRGYALAAPVSAAAVKARPLVVSAQMSVETGFRAIVSHCVAQMQDNEIGVMHDGEPESLHQMRVGMRRLRSALRLFAGWIPFPPALQQELAWLAGELGAARDAEVLVHATLPKLIEACPEEADLLPLRQVALTVAQDQRRLAAEAVASVRYTRLLLGLVHGLKASRWRESLDGAALDDLAEPLDRRARSILARRHRKLIQLGRRLAHGTPAKRHEVRIAAKKARYAAEFFQGFYPARQVNRYLECLAALQDTLGCLNDAAVADEWLRKIVTSRPEVAGGASFARGYLCAATRQDVRRLRGQWKAFCSSQRPWVRPK